MIEHSWKVQLLPFLKLGSNREQLCTYNAHFNSIGPGKGLAIFIKDDTFKPIMDIKQEKMHVTKFQSQDLDLIIVYRSDQGNTKELLQHLENLVNKDMATVVCGDFNVCYQTSRNNRITQYLDTNGFLHLGHSFHDHPSIYIYSPYYSDHDALCATLTRIPG